MIGDAPVLRLRGELVPLVRLDATLRIGATPFEGQVKGSGATNVVVLSAEGRLFGLVVDEVLDTQEIVVKPLDRRLRALSMFAGATIMGDGCVALILDVTGLAVSAHVLAEPRRASGGPAALSDAELTDVTETVLAVTGDHDAPMAIPLSQVMRLEEFPSSSVEQLGGRDVVQYRRDVLPLIHVSDLLAGRTPRRQADVAPSGATVKTVVYSRGDVLMGLVVQQILDTVEHRVGDQIPGGRRGVLASAVIHGRVTEILDLDALCGGMAGRVVPTSFLQNVGA
jgi:two-component system chemotaxis sensor kinase CheA